jgi:O-antigen/teichoic acid export membrane protein
MRPTLMLMSGRTVGFVAAFAIPMALARALNPLDFGTYRLLFLIYGTLLSLAQMGMAESLYYFVPRRPEEAGRWAGNAVATLAGIGIGVGVLLDIAAAAIGRRFNNPLLAAELPKLSVFLGLMLSSTVLEIVMVCRRQYRNAATVYGTSDVMRALLLAVPALLFRSVDALMTGAIVFAALRAVIGAIYLHRELDGQLGVDGRLWRGQLAYALPFAAAVAVEVAQINLHQYAVALWFDPVTLGIYSVGCLQIPIVDLLANSAANVMMVSMSDHLAIGRSTLALWHETVERLAFVFFPMVAILLLTARELILVMFTARYLGAVPIFMISIVFILLSSFPVDGVLRVYAETRTLLLLSLLRLTIIAAGIGWFVSTFHLPGAVLVTVAASVTAKIVGLGRVAHLMDVPVRRLLPWRGLAATGAAALTAVVPAWLLKSHLAVPPLVLAACVGLAYGAIYLALISCGSLLRPQTAAAVEPSQAA